MGVLNVLLHLLLVGVRVDQFDHFGDLVSDCVLEVLFEELLLLEDVCDLLSQVEVEVPLHPGLRLVRLLLLGLLDLACDVLQSLLHVLLVGGIFKKNSIHLLAAVPLLCYFYSLGVLVLERLDFLFV